MRSIIDQDYGEVDFTMSYHGRIQPPFDLIRKTNAYQIPGSGDGLRVYEHPDTGQELFSVTSIKGAVKEKPERLVTWEQSDPVWADYWRAYTQVRGTYIHERVLGQYADRPMPGRTGEFELESEIDKEALIQDDDCPLSSGDFENMDSEIENADKMWTKLWSSMGHEFGEVHGVEVKVWNPELSYAGTFDLLLTMDGKMTLLDLKTSKEYYDGYANQLTAYKIAAQKMYGVEIEQMVIVRLCPDRRHNPFMKPEVHYAPFMEEKWKSMCYEFKDDILPLVKEVKGDTSD